jgi:general secretion pathway protein H
MSCAAGKARRSSSDGFTLLELMVVLAITALLAGLAATQLTARRGPSVEVVARDLTAALRQARSTAMLQRRETVFWLDLDHARYGVGAQPARVLPRDIALEMWTVADRAASGRGSIEFYPDGGASGGRIALSRQGQRSVVAVDWLDGAVLRAQ